MLPLLRCRAARDGSELALGECPVPTAPRQRHGRRQDTGPVTAGRPRDECGICGCFGRPSKGTVMKDRSIVDRLGALSGAAFVVLVFIGNALSTDLGSGGNVSYSPGEQVVADLGKAAGSTTVAVGYTMELAGFVMFLVFVAYLYAMLRRGEGSGGWLAVVVLTGGITEVAIKLGSGAVIGAEFLGRDTLTGRTRLQHRRMAGPSTRVVVRRRHRHPILGTLLRLRGLRPAGRNGVRRRATRRLRHRLATRPSGRVARSQGLGVAAAGVLITDQRGTLHGPLDPDTIRLGQALADVATIGLLQARAIRQRDTVAEQLQTALNSRVIIEQAKGVIAERRHLDMDQSFILLRSIARTNNRRLSDLARAVVDGSETL